MKPRILLGLIVALVLTLTMSGLVLGDDDLDTYLAHLQEGNLIVNPDFENEADNAPGNPAGWAPTLNLMDFNRAIWDETTVLSGNYSIRMSAPISTESVWESDPIDVQPGTTYRFTGYVKTENLVVDRARFHGTFFVQAYDGDRPLFPRPTAGGPNFDGTNDWTKVTFEFTAPNRATHVIVTATLSSFGRAQGHVWFDALKLEEVVDE